MKIKKDYYVDVDVPFKNLVNQFRDRYLRCDEKFMLASKEQFLDVAIVVEYQNNDNHVHVTAGPMEKKQGADYLRSHGEIQRFFNAPDVSDDLTCYFDSIPESFIYCHIETKITGTDLDIQQWDNFRKTANQHAKDVKNTIVKRIIEVE